MRGSTIISPSHSERTRDIQVHLSRLVETQQTPAASSIPRYARAHAQKKRSVAMGGSNVEVHSCKDSCTSAPQELCNEAPEPFNCSICLELVYKPIVQACGHIFCFWCAFQAMNVRRESQCPVCRRPYKYFPRVCELLHFALTKAVPDEYERRGREIQITEEQKKVFSPRLLESPRHSWSPRNFEDSTGLPWQMSLPTTPSSMLTSNFQAGSDKHPSASNSTLPAEGDTAQRDTSHPRRDIGSLLTIDDFACSFCHHLLYRPVVLNCGEVFCELCLKKATSCRSCPTCRAPHPSGSVLICLELDQYLESAFPTEYLKRKVQQQAENTMSLDCAIANAGDCKIDGHPHVGVGCDGCGMFPIQGDRYRCDECTEKIGFDLCGDCYNNGGSLLGRFNQEHRPNHRMIQINSGASHFLVLNMRNSSIQRRRQQQQTVSDLDDYIDSFVDY